MSFPPAPRKGIFAALWIPTDRHGRLLRRALSRQLAFLREHGVDGVLALGSTGEFPRFDLRRRQEVLAAVAELAGPLTVLANLSSIRLDEVIALGRTARSLRVAGAALMAPSFFPMAQADILEFLLRSAEKVDLPFYLYNFPELVGNRLDPETIAAFADRVRMAGIKQSGAEFGYHRTLVRLGREKDFSVFSGADTRLAEALALGAAGCIGGLVNFAPEPMVEIYRACAARPRIPCAQASVRMTELGRLVDRLTFPLNVACGLEARGFDPGAPKTVVSPESARAYRRLRAELRRALRSWGLR